METIKTKLEILAKGTSGQVTTQHGDVYLSFICESDYSRFLLKNKVPLFHIENELRELSEDEAWLIIGHAI